VIGYLAVIGASFAVSFASMPLLRNLAFRVGAVQHPDARRDHPRPTPILGGAGIVAGVLVGFLVAWLTGEFTAVFRTIAPPLGVVLATLTMYLVGQLDDLRDVSAPAKTAGSVLAGSILAISGVVLLFFRIPFVGLVALPPDLAVLITVLWVVGMAQAVNLIDGLDGLAAGVVAIAALAFFTYAFRTGAPIYAGPSPASLLSVIAAGAAIGFLPFNFHPARIFMGDSGAMLLGLLLAAATISGVGRTDAPTNTDLAALAIPVAIPLLVLAIPFTDVLWAILRRFRRGTPWYAPDKQHIHHRLLEIGHTHRQAVLLMYLWSALVAASALAITFIPSRTLAVTLLVGVAVVLVGTALPRMRRANRIRT
jgi:UDP-GlcNAc:undecaprenyl-phosphate/decaprenyl-phosphate GlcNAc-1-phosphate transferase